MKTLIFIHGGESFVTQEEYLDFLKNSYIARQIDSWEPTEKTEWKKEIANKWREYGGIVYMPQMPNKQSAKYNDWKMVFEAIIKNISKDAELTLIGNSLGGCFLLKYFSEHSLEHKIDQIHLVAACISEGDFRAPTNYESLQQLGNRVHIWHAEDDRVVPFSVGQYLSKILPDAQTLFFGYERGYGHFYGVEKISELEKILIR